MELKPDYKCPHTVWLKELLIVPYGIETVIPQWQKDMASSFNRTLWN